MATVYAISFLSTGQAWLTYVCANRETVLSVLKQHRITDMVYGPVHGLYQEWGDPIDKSQTAIVRKHIVLES